MTTYVSEQQLEAAGMRIEHQPQRHRFAILRGEHELGEAHYSLVEGAPDKRPSIVFDHTYVDPSLRGSGLAALLAERALTDEIVHDREIIASCWYIREYLERNPQLRH